MIIQGLQDNKRFEMEFWAELKSKEELEADFPMIVSAFVALAEEILEREEIEDAKPKKLKSKKKPVKSRSKPLATSPALPLVCDSKKR